MKKTDYFEHLMQQPDEEISVAEASLEIAADHYPDLNKAGYLKIMKQWGTQAARRCRRKNTRRSLEALNRFLFEDLKFAGNIEHYYDPKNSFLNEVIDRRIGIPITLSVIYMEILRYMDFEAGGVGFPGHFLVRVLVQDEPLYIDAFHKGKTMTAEGCREFWEDITDSEMPFSRSFLAVIPRRMVLVRILRNLKRIYLEREDLPRLSLVLDRLVTLSPETPEEIRDRGLVHYQQEAYKLAMKDFQTFLSVAPEAPDSDLIRQYLQILGEYSSRMN